jgi:hypothetical protein
MISRDSISLRCRPQTNTSLEKNNPTYCVTVILIQSIFKPLFCQVWYLYVHRRARKESFASSLTLSDKVCRASCLAEHSSAMSHTSLRTFRGGGVSWLASSFSNLNYLRRLVAIFDNQGALRGSIDNKLTVKNLFLLFLFMPSGFT